MRITTRGRYALRASVALARLQVQGLPVSISALAKEEDISSIFLEQIFFRLRKAGVVTSVRGPGGGFCFAKPLKDLNVKEILTAAGEDLKMNACDKNEENCGRIGNCSSHSVWEAVNTIIGDYLENLTLDMVLKNEAPETGKPGETP